MTNYNDGKWHGWNGGECPVHPMTVVKLVVWAGSEGGGTGVSGGEAGDFCWSNEDTPIIAFRVVKEHREPREWWVNVYPNGAVGCLWARKEDAPRAPVGKDEWKTIKVREVTE